MVSIKTTGISSAPVASEHTTACITTIGTNTTTSNTFNIMTSSERGAFHRTQNSCDDEKQEHRLATWTKCDNSQQQPKDPPPTVRKRGRNQKIFNPGPLGDDDVCIYTDNARTSHMQPYSSSRGKSIENMRRCQRSFDEQDDGDDPYDSRVVRKRGAEYEDEPPRVARKKDYEGQPLPRKRKAPAVAPEVIDVDSIDDDQIARWKRDYEGTPYDDPEASRVFPGYSGRHSPFTNKPSGSFPAVVSKSLCRSRDEEASDEEMFDDYGGYERSKLAVRRHSRYEDVYDQLRHRRIPRHRRRPLEPDYPDYREVPFYRHRRSDSLEEEEYYWRDSPPSLYAPDERHEVRGHCRTAAATKRECGKSRVPETVSIISNDSRGSETVDKPTPPGKRHKKTPLQLPQGSSSIDEERGFAALLDQPDLLEQPAKQQRERYEERTARIDEDKPWDEPNRRASPLQPMYPTFDFCVGDVESHIDYHIMIMTAHDHERNPMVTELMMEDRIYTAYPFKRRELLDYAQDSNLEPIAKAVAQMFQKFRKDVHVRVEFIGHRQFVEGRAISLVVGTVENEPLPPKRPVNETSVVTIVGGTFKGGRGVVRAIRDQKVLLVMYDNGSNVLRWMKLDAVELMDESRLLNQLVSLKPQTNHHRSAQREVDSLLLDPSCIMDSEMNSEMMSALQNDLFIDGTPEHDLNGRSEAGRNDVRNDDFLDKDRTAQRGRKDNNDTRDFLADIEDHLSASFDPDLYHMMDSDKLGTPRPYDDGPSFLSPFLRDPRYVDDVDKFGSRPSSDIATQNSPEPAEEAKKAVNASDGPSIPSLKADDENNEIHVQAKEKAVVTLQQSKRSTPSDAIAMNLRPKVAKIVPDVEEEDLKPAAVEAEDVDQTTDCAVEPASRDYAPITTATVDAIAVKVQEHRQPLKKRKSVPAMDLLDRRISRTNLDAEDPLPRPPSPPIDDDGDIPPSTQEKVYVNGINENSSGSQSSPVSKNDVAWDNGGTAGIHHGQEEEETESKPAVKRGRGRPKKCRDRDTSSAWNFLQSMSVLELKDKLRRMKLPSSGNRTKLFYKITNALMVDKETPTEVLPDMITRFTP